MTSSVLYHSARGPVRGVRLSFELGGRTRTITAPRPLFHAGLVIAGLTIVWSLATAFYFAYRDDLFATVLAREVSAQYAYEDRIASLRTALERETSHHLVLQSEIDTQVRSLVERQTAVETRTDLLRALAEKVGEDGAGRLPIGAGRGNPSALGSAGVSKAAARVEGFQLRLGEEARAANPVERRSEADSSFGPALARLDAHLARNEIRQIETLDALRRPTQTRVGQLRAALAMAGVSAARIATGDSRGSDIGKDVGGPFVPLPSDAVQSPFWAAVARTGDDITELARLRRIAATVPLRQPLAGPLDVSSEFGPRLDPFLGRPALHTGIDFHGETGTQVMSTAAGTVTIASRDGGYGNMVEIDHGNGLVTRYAHLAAVLVAKGRHVEPGDPVGLVGSTGRATGPHLHYETRVNGEPVDPTRFLKAGAILFSRPQPVEDARLDK